MYLQELVGISEIYSHSRKVLTRVGRTLMNTHKKLQRHKQIPNSIATF